jgi:hypothetical protein
MGAFESNRQYYFIFRYGFGILSIFLAVLFASIILTESTVSINGEDEIASFSNLGIFMLFIPMSAVLHFIVRSKAAHVKILGDEVSIESIDGINTYKLNSITSIRQVQFVKPPLYQIRVSPINKNYIFIINDFYLEFNGVVKDLSQKRESLDRIKANIPTGKNENI